MRDTQNYQTERSVAALNPEDLPAASGSTVDPNNLPEGQSRSQEERPRLESSSLSESPISEPGQRKDVADSSGRHAIESHLKIRYSKVLLYVFCFQFIFQILLALCLAGVFGYYGLQVAAIMVIVLVTISILVVVDGVSERLKQIKRGSEVYS